MLKVNSNLITKYFYRKQCSSVKNCLLSEFKTGFSSARPFEEIPGPKSVPFVGTLYKYIPILGEYDFKKLDENGRKKLNKYGLLVKEEIVPGENIIWVYRPEDIAQVFKADIGDHPERKSHLALLKYRTDRKNVYNTGGLLPTNGPEWWKLRKEFQKALSKPQNIINYIKGIDKIVETFVDLIGERKTDDLTPLISRLFLELTCLVAFDASMNSFSKEEMDVNSKSSRLINSAFITNSLILKLDNGPRLWRYFNTPMYRKLCESQKFMEEIAVEMVNSKIREMEDGLCEKESLLKIYLKNENLDVKDVVGMACDMLLAGVDTTTYSIAFALYHLANNEKVQIKLHEETKILLPSRKDPITPETLSNASYTKAVIKETFRLNPISVGVSRILKSDIVLNGYRVPKNTIVVTQNQVICRLPEYFNEPDSFIPERWLRDGNEKSINKNVNPYLVLPFGHGARSCIARRLAEQNMQMILLRICRNYEFKWKGGVLNCESLLINKPNGPLNIEFSPIL